MTNKMSSRDVYLLCGNFERNNFIYAIKFNEGKWHYFDEKDALIDHHVTLASHLEHRIEPLKNVLRPLFMSLSEDQFEAYVQDGKFTFKEIELKTHTQLRGQPDQRPSKHKSKSTTEGLVFKIGKTNPANFLSDFEKCTDVKVDKDKLFKIRDFVKQEDRQEFSALYFKGDWESGRNLFLNKYSYAFTENKKRALSVDFNRQASLRGFFIDKMDAMTTYTELSYKNQIEMILADLPNEISNLFIVKDKTNCSKTEILKFCDSIQEFADDLNTISSGSTTPIATSEQEDQVEQDMEIVVCQSDRGSEIESLSGLGSSSRLSRNKNKARAESSLGIDQPPKKIKKRHTYDEYDESETSQSDSTIE